MAGCKDGEQGAGGFLGKLNSSALALSMALSMSCATISEQVVPSEWSTTKLRDASEPQPPTAFVSATTDDIGVTFVATQKTTCKVLHEQQWGSQTNTVRTSKRLWIEYLVGIVGLGSGVAVGLDAKNVPSMDGPMATNPIGRTGAYAIAASTLVVGAVALGFGVHHSFESRDDDGAITYSWRALGDAPTTKDCGKQPLANTTLWASLPRAPNHFFQLAITDADGIAKIKWSAFPAALVRTVPAEASWSPIATISVVDGKSNTSTEITVAADHSASAGTVDITPARGAASEKAWSEQLAKNTSEALAAFDTWFPGEHAQESQERQRTLRISELGSKAQSLLNSGKSSDALDAANKCLDLDKTENACKQVRAKAAAAVVAAAVRDANGQLKARDFDAALATATSCLAAQPDSSECKKLNAKATAAHAYAEARAEAKRVADEAKADREQARADAKAAAEEAKADRQRAWEIKHPPVVTAAEYNQLSKGMSYQTVVNIFGSPGEVLSDLDSGGSHTIDYKWRGEGYAAALLMFQNGLLEMKAESGLK